MGSRKCQNLDCGKRFKVPNDTPPWVRWCSDECKVEVGVQEVAKARVRRERAAKKQLRERKKENAKQKREYQRNSLRIRKKAAKEACHAYIRERDKSQPCICCGRPLGDNYHAGHFLESGNNPFVRYDEVNINAQSIQCNYFKGGDSGDYERNLRAKFGDAEVDRILALRGGTLKRTPEDYLKIEHYYKDKLKELERKDAGR